MGSAVESNILFMLAALCAVCIKMSPVSVPFAVLFLFAARYLEARRMVDTSADIDARLAINGELVATAESITHVRVSRRTRRVTFIHGTGSATLEFRTVEGMNDALFDFEPPLTTRITLVVDGTRVVAGTDGIRVGGTRIQFADIASTVTDGEALVLRKTNGSTMRIHLGGLTRMVGERVQHAIDQRDALPATDVLARRDRPSLEWTRELRIASDTASYRKAGIEPEALWRLVESPSATPADRASAAVALSSESLSNDDRKRLRVMAGETMSAPVAKTFVRVAEDASELALAEALEEVDALGDERGGVS